MQDLVSDVFAYPIVMIEPFVSNDFCAASRIRTTVTDRNG